MVADHLQHCHGTALALLLLSGLFQINAIRQRRTENLVADSSDSSDSMTSWSTHAEDWVPYRQQGRPVKHAKNKASPLMGVMDEFIWPFGMFSGNKRDAPGMKVPPQMAASGNAEADAASSQPVFKRVPTQFIAADPGMTNKEAKSGKGASEWGIWRLDPGPRGVMLAQYSNLNRSNGQAPAGWTFDPKDWWVEEYGRIMEKPDFPIPTGRYQLPFLNGPKAIFGKSAILTIVGDNWSLDNGATLDDVTHRPCRSARYTPAVDGASPKEARLSDFPVTPGAEMPRIDGYNKKDYAVLFVEALEM
jgi:hypothetical protein